VERADNDGWQRSTDTTCIERNMESFGIIIRHQRAIYSFKQLCQRQNRAEMHFPLHPRIDQHDIIVHIVS
jgi:hypothetical protein